MINFFCLKLEKYKKIKKIAQKKKEIRGGPTMIIYEGARKEIYEKNNQIFSFSLSFNDRV